MQLKNIIESGRVLMESRRRVFVGMRRADNISLDADVARPSFGAAR